MSFEAWGEKVEAILHQLCVMYIEERGIRFA